MKCPDFMSLALAASSCLSPTQRYKAAGALYSALYFGKGRQSGFPRNVTFDMSNSARCCIFFAGYILKARPVCKLCLNAARTTQAYSTGYLGQSKAVMNQSSACLEPTVQM